jgi:hypothetical protein
MKDHYDLCVGEFLRIIVHLNSGSEDVRRTAHGYRLETKSYLEDVS